MKKNTPIAFSLINIASNATPHSLAIFLNKWQSMSTVMSKAGAPDDERTLDFFQNSTLLSHSI